MHGYKSQSEINEFSLISLVLLATFVRRGTVKRYLDTKCYTALISSLGSLQMSSHDKYRLGSTNQTLPRYIYVRRVSSVQCICYIVYIYVYRTVRKRVSI